MAGVNYPERAERVLNVIQQSAILPSRERVLLMTIRQVLLMALAALEDYLELPRSVTPKHLR